MTIEEKRKAIRAYCIGRDRFTIPCIGCPLFKIEAIQHCDEHCYEGDANIERNYTILFGAKENPYWDRICAMSDRQRAKGLNTYGQGIESNPADILKRIEHLQEELIDGLMYCEWIKEWLRERDK